MTVVPDQLLLEERDRVPHSRGQCDAGILEFGLWQHGPALGELGESICQHVENVSAQLWLGIRPEIGINPAC